jgi:hypothetical protein
MHLECSGADVRKAVQAGPSQSVSPSTMKFTLLPDNRAQPDEVLLEDLRSVASQSPGLKTTKTAYGRVGRFSPATIANRFGGWGKALERAGLQASRHFGVTKQEAVQDLQRVAGELTSSTVAIKTYIKCGRYSEKPFLRHFGGWPEALHAAGLEVSENYHPRLSDEMVFANLETVWRTLGRQPKRDDMVAPSSRFSGCTYTRRFRSWRKALEAFVAAAGREPSSETDGEEISVEISSPTPEPASAETPQTEKGRTRSIGWRLRYKVMERDRFTCRTCGRSPATDIGVILHLDHVVAWSRGGLTIEANLQTLCERCNVGKGAS